MNNKNQLGFNVVEGVIIVLVIAIVGFIGWRLYSQPSNKTNDATSISQNTSQTPKPTISSPSSGTAAPINPYIGWKAYCSTMGGLCLQYPTDWQEKDTISQTSETTYTDIATITSPSGALAVVYNPFVSGVGGGCPDATCFFQTDSIDQTYIPNSIGLKVYKGVWTNSSSIVPSYFISSDKQMSNYNLKLNKKVDVHFFYTMFTSAKDNKSIEAISVRNIPDSSYSSVSDAEAWFNKPEVITAGKILSSLTISK